MIRSNIETKDLFRALNKNLKEWKELSKKPQAITMYEDMLSDFYKRAGKNIKNPYEFSNRVKLSDDQEEELLDIALSFSKNTYTYEETFSDVYEKYKNRYGWTSPEDAIDFLDLMENYKNDSLIKDILSSEQIIELFNEGSLSGISEKDIFEMAYLEHSMNGATGDRLYNQIIGAMQSYDDGLQGWR